MCVCALLSHHLAARVIERSEGLYVCIRSGEGTWAPGSAEVSLCVGSFSDPLFWYQSVVLLL